MPFWAGYWGASWGGFWWICPLLALVVMAIMIFVCRRMMGGMMGFGCMGGHRAAGPGEFADVRRELQELRDEVRKLGHRN
jgi:hypothetical protein